MKNEMKKCIRVIVACVAVATFDGCLSIKLDSHGDKASKPISSNWHCACIWGGFWWCQDPESVCKIGKKTGNPGFRRVEVSSGPISLMASVMSLGLIVPVYVEGYEMKLMEEKNTPETAIDL